MKLGRVLARIIDRGGDVTKVSFDFGPGSIPRKIIGTTNGWRPDLIVFFKDRTAQVDLWSLDDIRVDSIRLLRSITPRKNSRVLIRVRRA